MGTPTTDHAHVICTETHTATNAEHFVTRTGREWSIPHCVECGEPMPTPFGTPPLPRRMMETRPYRCQSGFRCTRQFNPGEHETAESAERCHSLAVAAMRASFAQRGYRLDGEARPPFPCCGVLDPIGPCDPATCGCHCHLTVERKG